MIIRPNTTQYWNGSKTVEQVMYSQNVLCIWRISGDIAECLRYNGAEWYHDERFDVSKATLEDWIRKNPIYKVTPEEIIQSGLPF